MRLDRGTTQRAVAKWQWVSPEVRYPSCARFIYVGRHVHLGERQQTRMKQPPETGDFEFSFPFGPVSLQAASSLKETVKAQFRAHLPTTEFLLSGDVSLEIQWFLHESTRYESDTAPDVDNILKPLLDSITGPQGILIDDTQVQHVSCSWLDWTSFEQRLEIRIRFSPDLFVAKDNLVFVDFGNALCFPLHTDAPPGALELLVNHIELQLKARQELRKLSWDYYSAQGIMPIQRFFHRSRLAKFKVMPLSIFRGTLKAP
jgi:Holliday junction resolvase RusA-like endonuclease